MEGRERGSVGEVGEKPKPRDADPRQMPRKMLEGSHRAVRERAGKEESAGSDHAKKYSHIVAIKKLSE
jgi:hypothetical protein